MRVVTRVGARLGSLALLLIAVTALVFAGTELAPGDAATQALGPRASQPALEATRAELGLDRPAPERYLSWLAGLARGQLGQSAVTGREVSAVVAGPAGRTFALATVAAVGVLAIGVGGGVFAGLTAGRALDRALSTVALATLSLPEFVVASALVVGLALTLGWLPAVSLLPASGSVWDAPSILLLPALTLALAAGSYVFRLVRAAVADQADRPHVLAARLNGLSPPRILARHLLPGAAPQVASALAVTVPYLCGGAIVVETVFGYPGLGSTLVEGIAARDQVLVQGVVVLLAVTAAVAYSLADLVAALVDPRRAGLAGRSLPAAADGRQ